MTRRTDPWPQRAARWSAAGRSPAGWRSITGSTSGIGLGILEEMAAAGADVVMNGFGDAAQIEGELTRIREAHDVAVVYSAGRT